MTCHAGDPLFNGGYNTANWLGIADPQGERDDLCGVNVALLCKDRPDAGKGGERKKRQLFLQQTWKS
jgi:hypothetical protein